MRTNRDAYDTVSGRRIEINLIGGIFGGGLAGLVGAGVWAGLAYWTDLEVGWITWCIGLVVGWGVAIGGRGAGSQAGLLAVVVAVVCILAGKYLSITMTKEGAHDRSLIAAQLASTYHDDLVVISLIADQIVAEQSDLGKTIEWPSDGDAGQATGEADYLPGIWTQAKKKWDNLLPAEREQYRLHTQGAENTRRTIHESWSQIRDGPKDEADPYGLGLLDVLFFALAVATAFWIAAFGGFGRGVTRGTKARRGKQRARRRGVGIESRSGEM